MGDDPVDHTHFLSLFGAIVVPEEKDFSGPLLADLACQVGGAVTGVEAGHIGVGLFENGVFPGCQGEVADYVEAVPSTDRPAVDQRDDHLGHEADHPLDFQNVKAPCAVGVLVSIGTSTALISAGAEGVASVFGGGAVAGQEDAAGMPGGPGVIQGGEEFIHGGGPECIAHFGAVEGDSYDSPGLGPVIGDVFKGEVLHPFPQIRLENIGIHGGRFTGKRGHSSTTMRSILSWMNSEPLKRLIPKVK